MKKFAVFTFILVLFLAFFLQFPLKGSLTGDIDAIGNLAMYKQLKLAIDGFFGAGPAGTICYPVDKVWVYFGSDFGIGIIHVLLNYIGFNDLWAHYLFISLLFALNSYCLYLLLNHLFRDRVAALFGGLFFSFAQFTLGNLENPNTLVFFLSFLSLYYYFRSLESPKKSLKYFALAAGIGVIQIYFSPYNFLFHCIIWGVLILANEFNTFSWSTVRKYGITAVAYCIVILPFIKFYLFHSDLDIDYDFAMTPQIASGLGLSLADYLRCLPNHLYMGDTHVELGSWTGRIKAAYLGIAVYLLALIGIFNGTRRRVSLVLVIIGIIMATGPYLVFSPSSKIPNITYPLYEYLNFGNVFRITCRGFFISLFGLTLLAVSGFIVIKKARMFIPLFLLPLFVFAENISWPMYTYDHEVVLHPDPEFIDIVRSDHEAVLLSLPSKLFDYEGTHREYVYMYWQSFHKQNTINGSLGFFPKQRTRVDSLLDDFNAVNLEQVIAECGVNKIAFHKDYGEGYEDLLENLYQYGFLEVILNTERTVLFEVSN